MSASMPVVIASDQSVIPVSDNSGSLTVDTLQLPTALSGGRLDSNVGAWLGSTAPTVGQKIMSSSVPVVLSSDHSAIVVEGRAADGATAVGNPVLIGGFDGTNVQTLEQRNLHPSGSEQALLTRDIERTSATYYAVFDRITMSAAKFMATLFNTSSTRKVVIQRIWAFNWQSTAVAAGDVALILYRITERTAGTTVTIRSEDTNDVLSSGITADTNSTAVATDHMVRRIMVSGEDLQFSTIATVSTLLSVPSHALQYERRRGQRGLTLRENQGISVQFDAGDTDGSVSFVFEFTDEVA
jgi:hypothetical protein